jgi:preprotein translocase subunit SecF
MIDILGKRYWLFGLSLIIIIPGLLILAFSGLPLSIDFTGGTLLEVTFDNASPAPAEVLALFESLNVRDVTVQTTDFGAFVIRSSFLDDAAREQVITQMEARFGETTLLRYDSVGPAIGEQVTQRAALAVGVAALAVIVYIIFAFRGIQHAERYGLMAILAMVHDVAVVFSVAAIGSVLLGWEMDALFLTALLTVIGFSVQDKIVVFDRIRENANILRRLPYETLVNHSIVQTLQRSINTQLMTVEFLLLALALFGGVTLQEFAIILLVGLLSGTYSSIFIAAPLLVVWENREWRTWFGRSQTPA